jgi:hypothetical protein
MPAVALRRIARPGFARGLPQDRRMQFMLRSGLARTMELKRLTQLRISREAARAIGPRDALACLISVSIDAGICFSKNISAGRAA